MIHPDRVLEQKGTLVMSRGDRCYLHKIGEYLGRIEPGVKRSMQRYDQVSVKEYSSSFLLQHISADLISSLK